MQAIKKLIAMFVAVVLILGCIPVMAATTFPDVPKDAPFYEAVTTLASFGIIKGYDDGTFGPDKLVTRAEFTALIMRFLGLAEVTDTGEPPFNDISAPGLSWAMSNIIVAYKMGIINGMGDGTFAPEANVTYEQALKMIVCSLGYEVSAKERGGSEWYSGYISVASDLGITKKAGGQITIPASRAVIAQLLFDSLLVDKMEEIHNASGEATTVVRKGVNVLNDNLRIKKNVGIISANDLTALDTANVSLKADEIQITAVEPGAAAKSTNVYKTANPEMRDLLGSEITYYYSHDEGLNVRTIIYAEVTKSNTLTITASNLEPSTSTSNTISYRAKEDSATRSTVTLASNNRVIYNGKLHKNYAFTPSMLPLVGSVKLLDSNNDGSYDIVFIENYDIYVITSVSSTDYNVIDNNMYWKDSNGAVAPPPRTINLDEGNPNIKITIKDKNGTAYPFSSLKQWDVLCVKETYSDSTALRDVTVITEKVTGEITEVSSDMISIDGKEYNFSEQAPFMMTQSSTLSLPAMGDKATFYLDINGDIVMYSKSSLDTNTYYGYIMGAAEPKATLVDQRAKIYLLSQTGTTGEYSVSKTVRINGKSYTTAASVLNELASSADGQNRDGGLYTDYCQVIKFSTIRQGGEEVIDNIYTNNSTSTDVNNKVDHASNIGGNVEMTYNKSSVALGTMSGTSFNSVVGISGAQVFVVPENRSILEDYRKGTTSELKDGQTYMIEAYDLSSTKTAKVIVLYGESANIKVDPTSPVVIVTGKSQSIKDGASMYKITGLSFDYSDSGRVVTEWVETASSSQADKIRKGDIIRYGRNSKGEIREIEVIMSYADNSTVKRDSADLKGRAGQPEAQYNVIRGSVIAKDVDQSTSSLNSFIVAPTLLESGADAYTQGSTDEMTVLKSNLSSAKYYKLDTLKGEVEVTESDSTLIDNIRAYEDIKGLETIRPTELFIYMTEGRVRLVVEIVR